MWSDLANDFERRVADSIGNLYGLAPEVPILLPPSRDLGDLSTPVALSLARELKQAPREIAETILNEMQPADTDGRIEVAGAGYLNLFLDRQAVAAHVAAGRLPLTRGESRRVVVEHTNINPNKAAHIGHLRNAVLGDTLGRLLRAVGHQVEIQNYIDDTGVQVADVVVGFADIEGKCLSEVAAIPEPFDYHCWDLYARVGEWYGDDPERQQLRRDTLHQLEAGEGERAEIGSLVARRIVSRHLRTMARLGIGYDLLTRESDILALDFFVQAFEALKQAGAVRLESEGKNEGCWVMPLAGSEEFEGLEDPDKVIVRSDGTITYVGKDIAYQQWKFGLLGRDFDYHYWAEEGVWHTDHSGAGGAEEARKFDRADHVVNVIDARQSYLQKVVRAGLEALGYEQQAADSFHFAYEMVALSAATAAELGVGGESGSVEMSGRTGIGVKADDLIDQLIDKSRLEIDSRDSDLDQEAQATLARQIAVSALRFFMAKATTTRVIAFDLEEALAFEGETGPYLQYSAVRARNIRRKLDAAGIEVPSNARISTLPSPLWDEHDDLWDLVVTAARVPEVVAEAASPPYEISLVARHALDLAQKFNAAYHRHPVLQEEDEGLRALRLAAFRCFEHGLEQLAELLGIELPEQM